jgi:hypothetical protein
MLNAQSKIQSKAEILVQEQLNAYNERDFEAFIKPYSSQVKVYLFPNTVLYDGLEEMGSQYGRMFARTPELHALLLQRIVNGNTIIDHQKITINPAEDPLEVTIVYKIKENKISEVYFIYKD